MRRIILYVLAFLLPPILACSWMAASTVSGVLVHKSPAPLAEGTAEPHPALKTPRAIPGRLTAVILMSNAGTQLTDLLAPYGILSASGQFHVVTAAPLKQLSPTTGSLAVFPDFALADAPHADLIVIPAVLDPSNQALVEWLRKEAPKARLVLSVCEGARVAAEAGLLEDRNVATHFMAIADLKTRVPGAHFKEGARYLTDGKLVSSAGITASMDGALAAIQKLRGETAARETAQSLGYEWKKPEGPATPPVSRLEAGRVLLNAAFHWSPRAVGVAVFPGVSEIGLSSLLETFPRTFASHVFSFSEERKAIFTRHGLKVVATESASGGMRPDLILVSSGGETDPLRAPWLEKLVRARNIAVKSYFNDPPGKGFDQALELLSQLDGTSITRLVAKVIEYPWNGPLKKDAPESDLDLTGILLKIVLLGLLGMLLAWTIERRVSRRAG